MTDRTPETGPEPLSDIILDGGLRLPGFDHWRERASSNPSDPDDIRWDCSCGYSGSPETIQRHWHAILAAARPSPAEPPVADLRAALRAALPRAVNFRIPLARTVDDPIWDTITDELVDALKAETPEPPLDAERLAEAIFRVGTGYRQRETATIPARIANSQDGARASGDFAELVVTEYDRLAAARLTSDTQPPAEPGEVER